MPINKIIWCLCALLSSSVAAFQGSTEETGDEAASSFAIPTEEDQEDRRAAIYNRYGVEKALEKRAKAREKAAELIEESQRYVEEPPELYGLLTIARELAIEGRDPNSALEAARSLGSFFAGVDMRALQVETICAIGSEVYHRNESGEMCNLGLSLAAEALVAEDLATCRRLLEALQEPVKKRKDDTAKARFETLLRDLEERERFQSALATLELHSDDLEANTVVGRYHMFAEADFERGLPFVSRGVANALRSLALRDLEHPDDPKLQVALGDDWLSWSEQQPRRERGLGEQRASYWYALAAPNLSAFDREDLKPKLDKIAARAAVGAGSVRSRVRSADKVGVSDEVHAAVLQGLEWLIENQASDGGWKCANGLDAPHEGERYDVGVTGLATLALLSGSRIRDDLEIRRAIQRGLERLASVQDSKSGLLGKKDKHAFVYNHAIGTLAICEGLAFSEDPSLRRTAQAAVQFIIEARNPYAAWRYDAPPTGDNDTSITGWMVRALKSAEEAGLKTDEEALIGALAWIDEATDKSTGRVGYDQAGSEPSRITDINDHFSREKGESMTAVGLLCRLNLGQEPSDVDVMKKHAQLILEKQPEWDPDGYGNDLYYWYYGTYAMFEMGGRRYWKPWNQSLTRALVAWQRESESEDGSWDPVGPWGILGGRVYSTSLAVLALTRPVDS